MCIKYTLKVMLANNIASLFILQMKSRQDRGTYCIAPNHIDGMVRGKTQY